MTINGLLTSPFYCHIKHKAVKDFIFIVNVLNFSTDFKANYFCSYKHAALSTYKYNVELVNLRYLYRRWSHRTIFWRMVVWLCVIFAHEWFIPIPMCGLFPFPCVINVFGIYVKIYSVLEHEIYSSGAGHSFHEQTKTESIGNWQNPRTRTGLGKYVELQKSLVIRIVLGINNWTTLRKWTWMKMKNNRCVFLFWEYLSNTHKRICVA